MGSKQKEPDLEAIREQIRSGLRERLSRRLGREPSRRELDEAERAVHEATSEPKGYRAWKDRGPRSPGSSLFTTRLMTIAGVLAGIVLVLVVPPLRRFVGYAILIAAAFLVLKKAARANR